MRNAMNFSLMAGQWISVVSGVVYIVSFVKEHVDHRSQNEAGERIEQKLDELARRVADRIEDSI